MHYVGMPCVVHASLAPAVVQVLLGARVPPSPPCLERACLQDCPSITQEKLKRLLASVNRYDLDVLYRKGGAQRQLYC